MRSSAASSPGSGAPDELARVEAVEVLAAAELEADVLFSAWLDAPSQATAPVSTMTSRTQGIAIVACRIVHRAYTIVNVRVPSRSRRSFPCPLAEKCGDAGKPRR